MKRLPIGVQSIRKILEEELIYIDKTLFAKELIEEGKHYFISRPRRFGKSLFLNTLEEICRGDKDLFKSCAIYDSNYNWEKYPIIYLDFAQIKNTTPDEFEKSLGEALQDIAKTYNLSITAASNQTLLKRLCIALAENSRVVVLVDEYDQPIINTLKNPKIAKQNRDLLKDFFGTLKSLDRYLKLTFITGISKFSQVSFFSGMNNLNDLTLDGRYATMMGYTEKEVTSSFKEYISKIANKQGKREEEIIDEARVWYNGYNFSKEGKKVYNPFSTLQYMNKQEAANYWYSTGTPSFLIDTIKNDPTPSSILADAAATESQLMDISDLNKITLVPLMYQTGYLTLEKYFTEEEYYSLNFPNKEVKKSFFNSLIQDYAGINPIAVTKSAKHLIAALETYDFESFFKSINIYFANVPYQLLTAKKESLYHAIFLIIMQVLGLKVSSEIATSIGRIDLVVETSKAFYIFELKLDQNAEKALAQAEKMDYKEKYLGQGKELALIGVNFSSKAHKVNDWKKVIFKVDGTIPPQGEK